MGQPHSLGVPLNHSLEILHVVHELHRLEPSVHYCVDRTTEHEHVEEGLYALRPLQLDFCSALAYVSWVSCHHERRSGLLQLYFYCQLRLLQPLARIHVYIGLKYDQVVQPNRFVL